MGRISVFGGDTIQLSFGKRARVNPQLGMLEKALKSGGPAHLGLDADVVASVVSQSAIKANSIRDAFAGRLLEIVQGYEAACALAHAAHGQMGEDAYANRQRLRILLERVGKTEIRESYRAQWRAGKDSGGNLAALRADERKLLDQLIKIQYAFFVNMLHDIEEGSNRLPLPRRVAQYAQCSAESYWAGMVLSDLSPDVYYRWTFAPVEHCSDCLKLGNGGRWAHTESGKGIYSAKELASMGVFPGSGRLACCTHCKCSLQRTVRPSAAPKGSECLSITLDGPGASSFEGEHRSDRDHLQARADKARWNFRGRLSKSIRDGVALLTGVSRETDGETPAPIKYGSTQLDIPAPVAGEFHDWTRRHIDDSELRDDGLELDTHVTAKFGVIPSTDDAMNALSPMCAAHPAIPLETGAIGVFRHSPEYDVVFVEVHSAELRMLHREIEAHVECKADDFPYHPHITLAYVAKGAGDSLEGNSDLGGRYLTLDALTLSSRERVKTMLPFAGTALPTDSEDAPAPNAPAPDVPTRKARPKVSPFDSPSSPTKERKRLSAF